MKKEKLIFLLDLYRTWPWYYDKDAIIEIQKEIICLQHREMVGEKRKGDFVERRLKRRSSKKTEFSPEKIND